MGFAAPPSSEPITKARHRFSETLQGEVKRRQEAEFKYKEGVARTAYHERIYDEVHAVNLELHARSGWGPAASAAPAAPLAQSGTEPTLAHAKRKLRKLIHPDKIPSHLRESPQVQEYSTSLSQDFDSCFSQSD